MMRLSGIPFRKAPGADCRTAAPPALSVGPHCSELANLGVYIVHILGFGSGRIWCRIGPDSACFRGSPVFAGEGMQFESHLGHVFSLFRGLWASECVQISSYGPLRGLFLLVCRAGPAAPSLGLDSGVAAYSFMAGSAWNCMTC